MRWGVDKSIFQVALAAFCLALPAFYNGFPILYPDSMTYLDDGHIVARALFLRNFSDYYGMRSLIYSLVILPFHWNRTAWPIVAMQCCLTAYLIWLVFRSIVPRLTGNYYLGLILLLSLVTSVSWCSSLILPDILGSLLYLALYLLAFAKETLSRLERWVLYFIVWWGVASHASHLIVSSALCLFLAVVLMLRRQPLRRVFRTSGEAAVVIGLAAASQLALNIYLYGQPSLNGERPPFPMARVIADGPGRWYLERNCKELNWSICNHVHSLTADPDNFLWAPDGIWQSATDDEQADMLSKEMPLVLTTLRAYPKAQLYRSSVNFWKQLITFGLDDLRPSSWLEDQFATVMPHALANYRRSRQARYSLSLRTFTTFQTWIVIASLGIIAFLSVTVNRERSPELASLGIVISFVVIINAAITGVLSMPEDRFQTRVIWLVPLFAGLSVLSWLSNRHAADRSKTAHDDIATTV
jgi:hypothetical protein